ncbi:glutamate--tRNA ligase [Jatrophihabitans sp. YIM 134969]
MTIPAVGTSPVRVRFCPSPTGNPHVGLVRTALYNWAWCRHVGGTFVFRIEDTDAARDSETSYGQLLSAMRWLGFGWDEGPEVGGPYGPYRQSERREIYADVARRLLDGGYVYESFTTTEETEARHRAAGRDPKLGYDNHDRTLTDEQRAAFRAEGRQPVLRFRMPGTDIGWNDLVRGEITFAAEQVSDFVVVRANGDPLYTLTNPVDDAMMRITHVLRGEDLLPSTPRQIALYAALTELGVAESTPQFGHLPYVMGEGNKKLSKRDPQASLDTYRAQGYLPEGLLNYLALLGWSIAPDRDVFGIAEMVEAFDIADVGGNPARFDGAKCLAINGDHIRRLDPDDFAARLAAYAGEYRGVDLALFNGTLRAGAPLVQERCKTLGEAVDLLWFLVAADDFALDEKAAAKALTEDGRAVLAAGLEVLEPLQTWEHAEIEAALRAMIEARELKLGKALAPFRVAVTGGTVSPPLFESMALLGRGTTLSRLRAAIG